MVDFLTLVSENKWTNLHHFRTGRKMEGLVNLVHHFAIPQGTLPWQPIKVAKLAFFADQSSLSHCHSKRFAISQLQFQGVKWNKFLCLVYNFSEIRSSNARLYTVNNNTFCGDAAKMGISRQISQNTLNLSWPITTFTLCSGVQQRIRRW